MRVTTPGKSSVDLSARLRCDAPGDWDANCGMTKPVREDFEQNVVSIPYPHSVTIQKSP